VSRSLPISSHTLTIFIDILYCAFPRFSYVEEDGMIFLEATVTVSGAPGENMPYGITQAQGNSEGLPLAPSTSGACNDPNSFKVAVIDSGLEVGHPDVPCRPIDDSDTNCKGVSIGVNGEPWYNPKNLAFHGPHVFGTIGAIGGNNQGVTSMVPDSGGICYLIGRTFDDAGNGQFASKIFEAIDWAIDEEADVINMSLGGGRYGTGQDIFNEAYKRGVLSVAAAGNKGGTSLSYPASYEKVISVAAVNGNKQKASFSRSNEYVDIAGAGVNVLSTYLNGDYRKLSGTSMATPHVTGAIARIWSTCRECSNDQVEQCLLDTAEDLGPVGRDNDYGAGLLQTQNAYDCLVVTIGCCVAPVAPPSCGSFSSACASNKECCSGSCSSAFGGCL
jgi:serine protease